MPPDPVPWAGDPGRGRRRGLSAFLAGSLAGRLIWPVEFVNGAVFLGSFSALPGAILGVVAAGVDLGAEASGGEGGE